MIARARAHIHIASLTYSRLCAIHRSGTCDSDIEKGTYALLPTRRQLFRCSLSLRSVLFPEETAICALGRSHTKRNFPFR